MGYLRVIDQIPKRVKQVALQLGLQLPRTPEADHEKHNIVVFIIGSSNNALCKTPVGKWFLYLTFEYHWHVC